MRMRCMSQLLFGSEHMRNDCVRVAMTQSMLAFQPSDSFHVLHVPELSSKLKPVANGVAELLLDGWEVRGWTFQLFISAHN